MLSIEPSFFKIPILDLVLINIPPKYQNFHNHRDYQEHRNQYETEAESIAYIVSKYLGLQTTDYTLSYLYSWSKEKDFKEIDDSLNTIVNYSKKIISNFEKFFDREFGLYSEEMKAMNI